jgi:hypothetical protein
MKHPLVVIPFSQPYTNVVRFKNNRPNLLKTFAGMAKGQDILIRFTLKADQRRIQGAADNARVRIKMDEHPSIDTVRVTSLGPQRERVMSEIAPGRVLRFKTRRCVPLGKQPQKSKPRRSPRPPVADPLRQVEE